MRNIKRIILTMLFITFIVTGCSQEESKTSTVEDNIVEEKIITSMEEVVVTEEENEFGFFDDIEMYKIRYSSDGLNIVGYLVKPKIIKDTAPVIIFNRGGNREFGKLTDKHAKYWFRRYANRGYVVLASQYRGNDGSEGQEEFGGSDLNDVVTLIDVVKQTDYMDNDRIYMIGGSRGGMMTYMACRNSKDIKAATVFVGISDCIENYNNREQAMKNVYTSLIGGTPKEKEEEYIKRSAYYWADEITVPIYIFHGGEKDWRVSTNHAIKMAEKLEEYSKEYKLKIYEEEDHSFSEEAFIDMFEETMIWFDTH